MVNVIGVRFENAGKLYFFNPGDLWPTPGDYVVVETSRGVEFGEVVTQVQELDETKLNSPLRDVVRIANAEDVQHHEANKAAEKQAFTIGQTKINEHKLDMKLVSVAYTFDNRTLLFYFTANGRVDFRGLVKDLAGVFHTRIELRQIGVRDEAKMIGGLGPCGRPICCRTFLGDFQPVSIKMAKEQSLSLNPIKISGVCGRLMCCLKYEQDTYDEARKRIPKEGKEVMTPDGPGIVNEVRIIAETVRVRMKKGDSFEFREYPASQVQRMTGGVVQPQETEEVSEEETAPGMTDAPETLDTPAVEAEAGEAPKAERRERPAKAEHASRQDRRERPTRQERKPVRRADKPEEASNSPVAPQVEQEEPVKVTEAPKPTASSWKAALEQAMRAAQGNQEQMPEPIREQPVETAPETVPEAIDETVSEETPETTAEKAPEAAPESSGEAPIPLIPLDEEDDTI